MRNLTLIGGLVFGVLTFSVDAWGKTFPWGQVDVISSDGGSLEFEWVIEWPHPLPPQGASTDPSLLVLPGGQLTPESRTVTPWSVGAMIRVPEVESVSLEVLETKSADLDDVAGPMVDAFVRAQRYSALAFEHGPSLKVLGEQSEGWRNRSGEGDHPPFVEIASIGWLRGHRVVQLRCLPLRLDRGQESAERLERLRGRLIFTNKISQPELDRRTARLRSDVFDRVVARQVVNPESVTQTKVRERGLQRQNHNGDVPSSVAIKMTVAASGLYQLRGSVLSGRGVNLDAVDPATLRLVGPDGERPLWVDDGGDGQLGGDDRIVFYGEASASIYAVKNSYVLRWGAQGGNRMKERSGVPAAAFPSPAEFPETIHFEEDLHYWQNMVDGEGEDHWFWHSQLSGPDQRDYRVRLAGVSVSSSQAAELRVALKGLSSVPEILPDHHTRIYWNGQLVNDARWDGNSRFIQSGPIELNTIVEGENTVSVEVVGDLPVGLDQCFVDWIEVSYPRRLTAVDGRLAFMGDSRVLSVSGFRNDAIEIFDVTDPRDVIRILDSEVKLKSQGFEASFAPGVGPTARFIAVEGQAFRTPENLELVEESHWRSSEHQADYLVVSHAPFIGALEPLVTRRRAQGHAVTVVPVEELYEEFSGGLSTPDAIKRFVRHAYTEWTAPAPTYLLLVGDSTIDPRDIFGSGTPNLLPSEITEMRFFGESVSDDGFVLIDGDDFLPDLLVGRLPAETVEDLEVMVAKTLAYEQQVTDQAWNRRVMVVADDDTVEFEELSEGLIERLPDTFTSDRVFLSQFAAGGATAEIFQKINDGRVLINYTGHGSRSTWGVGDIEGILFENADAAVLSNIDALSVVTVANCLNGFFVARTTKPCLAEIFLRNGQGGAVAVWAPTSLGFPSGHRLLVGNFYQSIFEEGTIELGAAVLGAKIATLTDANFFKDQVRSYTFFGDPALELALPSRIAPLSVSVRHLGRDGIEISYPVREGRRYTLLSADSLAPDARWEPLLSGAPNDEGRHVIIPDAAHMYFRVEVSLIPDPIDEQNR